MLNMIYSDNTSRIIAYIEKTLGVKPGIHAWEGKNNLPLLLREQYAFYLIHISDTDCLVFTANRENQNTPAVILKHSKMLQQYWTGRIIYSGNSLSSTNRTRLIQAKVPFIIPEKQLYLPFFGIDLREIFPAEKKKSEKISPSSQLLILGQLYKKGWITNSPSRMAEKLGISNMSIGRAFSELELHDIASIKISGKEKTLKFRMHGKELWERVLSLLKSPVTSFKTIPYLENKNLVLAGNSALSCYSMLAEPEVKTFALFNREKTNRRDHDTLNTITNEEMIIQKWAYDPRVLSIEGIADPLSVYLEFLDTEDERIEQALENLLGDITW